MRLVAVSLLAAALVSTASVAAAASTPHMTATDRVAISDLVNRFIKDVVLRQDLADGWTLAGPDLRGGTTRKAWIAGTGVTVPAFPALGTDFRNSWTGKLVSPDEAQLSVILLPKPGSGADETAMSVDVRRLSGRWVVDLFYSTAVFRPSKSHRGSCGQPHCAISGPNDFGPAGGGSAIGSTSSRIRGRWLWIVLGAVGALVVCIPLGIYTRLKIRDRRAFAAWAELQKPQR